MYFISKSSEVWATLRGIESLFVSVSVCPGMHGHPGGGGSGAPPRPPPSFLAQFCRLVRPWAPEHRARKAGWFWSCPSAASVHASTSPRAPGIPVKWVPLTAEQAESPCGDMGCAAWALPGSLPWPAHPLPCHSPLRSGEPRWRKVETSLD